MSKSYLIAVLFFSTLVFYAITPVNAQLQTFVVSGTVVRNAHHCAMDGLCFLEVQKLDGTVAQIYYGWESLGEGIVCRVDKKLSDLAWSLKPGQVVEAKGQIAHDEKTIYLCTEQNHYLNVNSEK